MDAENSTTKLVDRLVSLFRSDAGIEFLQCLFQPDIHHDGIHRTRHLVGRNILPAVLLRLLDLHSLNISFCEHDKKHLAILQSAPDFEEKELFLFAVALTERIDIQNTYPVFFIKFFFFVKRLSFLR